MARRLGSKSAVGLRWDKARARGRGREVVRGLTADRSALRRMTRPQRVMITKDEARAQAARALARYCGMVTKEIACACGHRGVVAYRLGACPPHPEPPHPEVFAKDEGRCTQCGARI
jgi:DNA-directed RNA polymerase subunit RPC12/RpoP